MRVSHDTLLSVKGVKSDIKEKLEVGFQFDLAFKYFVKISLCQRVIIKIT